MSEAEHQSAAAPIKRRWYQYRLRTLMLMPLLLGLVLSAIYSWPYVHRRYLVWRLQEYVDRYLWELPHEEKKRVDRWIFELTGQKLGYGIDPFFEHQNWLVHSLDIPGVGRRMYIVEMEPTISIPGNSGCRLHSLDSWGRLLRATEFNIGYRAWPKNAVCDEPKYGYPCLIVEMDGMWTGNTRQYYRITDDYVELLRSEHLDGRCAMGHGTAFDVQAKPPDWSDWQKLLDSPDRLQQFRGLSAFWTFTDGQNHKPIDEKVRHRMAELAASPDPWISEEAKLALDEAKEE